MTISIVVVSHNTRDLLRACLAALAAHPPTRTHDVWVVDNASADGSVDMVRAEFPAARVIANADNRGFAAANNQAIAASAGDYVLLLNSDAFVAARAVDRLADVLDATPRAGACGGLLSNPDGSFQASFADFPTLASELALQLGLAQRLYGPAFPSYDRAHSGTARAVDWVGGACMLVRRACIDRVGLLDEEFFMYGEEMDWCRRMRAAGWEVRYTPEARVTHVGGGSAGQRTAWTYLQIQAGHLRYYRKHHGRAPTAALFAATWVINIAKTALALASAGPRRSRWRTYWSAAWSLP